MEKSKYIPTRKVPIRQFTVDGVFVREYTSIKEAAQAIGCKQSNISQCLTRRSHTAAGFVWRYAEDIIDLQRKIKEERERQMLEASKKRVVCRPVYQYSLDGKFIREFQSIKEASRFTGAAQSSISACCSGKKGYHKVVGYIWRYADSVNQTAENQKTSGRSSISGGSTSDATKKQQKCANPPDLKSTDIVNPDEPVSLKGEVWKSLTYGGYRNEDDEWMYEVSNFGRVKKRIFSKSGEYRKSKLLVTTSSNSGTVYVTLSDGIQHTVQLDLIVATEFVDNPYRQNSIRHLDGNSSNCCANNLVWESRHKAKSKEKAGVVAFEIWKPVVMPFNRQFPNGRYEYEISSYGRVRRFDYENLRFLFLKPFVSTYGELKVSLTDKYEGVSVCNVSMLVAKAFLTDKTGTAVRNIDGDKTNNHVENLEWC